MIRVKILCEGQTEERFVKDLLAPHLGPKNIWVTPIGLDGVKSFKKVKREIEILLKQDSQARVTTMIDYYGLPASFPLQNGHEGLALDSFQKAELVEKKLTEEIAHPRFIANLSIHEFEGLLYSQPEAFAECCDEQIIDLLQRDLTQFSTPEHINSHRDTAPSKRIQGYYPKYSKTTDGILIAKAIGLDGIRRKCAHFNSWITKLESLGGVKP